MGLLWGCGAFGLGRSKPVAWRSSGAARDLGRQRSVRCLEMCPPKECRRAAKFNESRQFSFESIGISVIHKTKHDDYRILWDMLECNVIFALWRLKLPRLFARISKRIAADSRCRATAGRAPLCEGVLLAGGPLLIRGKTLLTRLGNRPKIVCAGNRRAGKPVSASGRAALVFRCLRATLRARR